MNIKVIKYNGERIMFDFIGDCIFDNVSKLIYLKSVLGYEHEITIPIEFVKTISISEQEEKE